VTGFLSEALGVIEPYVAAYGVAAIFLIVCLESLGLPLPGESALVAAGVLSARGDLDLAPALLAVFGGAVLGDGTGYWIGRFGGRPLLQRFGPYLKITPERLDRLEKLFRDRGAWIVATARFVVVLRQLNGVVAGSVSMSWPRFLLANALGAALWTAAWGGGSYLFADALVARG
jgi:membrane protein DedA with SNARE-associated domain